MSYEMSASSSPLDAAVAPATRMKNVVKRKVAPLLRPMLHRRVCQLVCISISSAVQFTLVNSTYSRYHAMNKP
jgi:hypothetical protein